MFDQVYPRNTALLQLDINKKKGCKWWNCKKKNTTPIQQGVHEVREVIDMQIYAHIVAINDATIKQNAKYIDGRKYFEVIQINIRGRILKNTETLTFKDLIQIENSWYNIIDILDGNAGEGFVKYLVMQEFYNDSEDNDVANQFFNDTQL